MTNLQQMRDDFRMAIGVALVAALVGGCAAGPAASPADPSARQLENQKKQSELTEMEKAGKRD